MTPVKQEIEHCLADIECEMRRLAYWRQTQPSAQDLASKLPFCCDTLEFPQWLQFIFLSRMRFILDSGMPLPTTCGISPYAEEYFKQSGKDATALLKHLQAIDKLLTTI